MRRPERPRLTPHLPLVPADSYTLTRPSPPPGSEPREHRHAAHSTSRPEGPARALAHSERLLKVCGAGEGPQLSDSCSFPQRPADTARVFAWHPLCARHRADHVCVLAGLQAYLPMACPECRPTSHSLQVLPSWGAPRARLSAPIHMLAFWVHSAARFSLHKWPPGISPGDHLHVCMKRCPLLSFWPSDLHPNLLLQRKPG